MCCTIMIGGQFSGISIRKALTASVPPVEAPTKMIRFPLATGFSTGAGPVVCLLISTIPAGQFVYGFPLGTENSAACRKLSECPAKSSPLSLNSGAKRLRILYCVAREIDHDVTTENRIQGAAHAPHGLKQVDPLKSDQSS